MSRCARMGIVKKDKRGKTMKLNYKRTILIGLAFMSISAFWQMYDSIIPLILQNTFHLKETLTGTIMAADNVLALFLLPVFGALSDRTETRFGKRMPFIVIGTVLAVLFLMFLPVADRTQNQVFFMVALFAVLVSMGLYRSPAVALMPDLTPHTLRSKGNAIINLMGAVGGIYTLLMVKFLVGSEKCPDYAPLFTSVAVLMVVAVAVLFFTIKEGKIKAKVAEEVAAYEAREGVSMEAQEPDEEEIAAEHKGAMPKEVKRSMLFLLMSIFFWYVAYNAVTTAFSRYTQVVWGLEGGGFADCLMISVVVAILSYVPIGNISSRIGRKKTILIGVVMMIVSFGLAFFVTSYHPVINVIFSIVGIGWSAINVNSYPMVVEMSKDADVGKFTGTYYTFSMMAQIITPILSGFLLQQLSYRSLFPYAVVFMIFAFFTMLQVHHGDTRPDKKKSLLENFDVDD